MEARLLTMQQALNERNKAIRENGSMFQKEEAKRQYEMKKRMETLPDSLRDKTFSDFRIDYPEQTIIKKATEFVVTTFHDRLQESMCLTFLGYPGTGKTLLASILFMSVVQAGFSACYKPSLDFLREIQEKKFSSHTSYEQALMNYRHPDLLIIDEATEGSGRDSHLTAWEQKLLLHIIDWRQQNKRCTLLISNYTNEIFIDHVGIPIADRMQKNGVTLTFIWESYRKNKRK